MPKTLVRTELLKRRNALPPEEAARLGAAIQARVLQLAEYRSAATLALYHPLGSEVATDLIFAQARGAGKTVCFPRTRGHHLEFAVAEQPEDLVPGRYGIREPRSGAAVAVAQLDLILLPGVGFDRSGYRLGYGKGYYDRALSVPHPRTTLVGLGYALQVVESLPAEDHDVALHMVITEEDVYRYRLAASADAATSAC